MQRPPSLDSDSVGRTWLEWVMLTLRTTPQLLEERHPNHYFVLFLALGFPTVVAAILVRPEAVHGVLLTAALVGR